MTNVVGREIKVEDAFECLRKDPLFSVKLEEKYAPYWCKDGVIYFSDYPINGRVGHTYEAESHFFYEFDKTLPRRCVINTDPNDVYLPYIEWSKEAPEVF